MPVLWCYIATDGMVLILSSYHAAVSRRWEVHLLHFHRFHPASPSGNRRWHVSGNEVFKNDSKLRSVNIHIPFTHLTSQNGKMWNSWTIPYFCLQRFWNDVFWCTEAPVISPCRCCLTLPQHNPRSTSCEGKAMHSFVHRDDSSSFLNKHSLFGPQVVTDVTKES